MHLISLAGALALAFPQDPGPVAAATPLPFESTTRGTRLLVEPVPGTGRVSTWLCVAAGSDHDPADAHGISRVLGEVLRAELPDPTRGRPADVLVLDDATLVGLLVEPDRLGEHLDRIGRWLAGELVLDDDALLQARGRALIRADDEIAILPGPMLRERAEALLFPDAPAARVAAGDPEVIRGLTCEAIRSAFARRFHPARASLVLLGDLDPKGAHAAAAAALARGPERPNPADLAIGVRPADAPAVEPVTPAERVDGVFAAYAFPTPAWRQEGYLPFLIAIEVVRLRAAATFRTARGGEGPAEFPFVEYDTLRMPPAGYIERRGKDGDPLGSVDAEIDSLVAGLRAGGATGPEIQAALGALFSLLAVPPYREDVVEVLRGFPPMLHQRGYVLAAYERNGWPAELRQALAAVPPAHVDRALRTVLDPDRAVRVALEPTR